VTAFELDHHTLADEILGKRTPDGSVGQICDRTKPLPSSAIFLSADQNAGSAKRPAWPGVGKDLSGLGLIHRRKVIHRVRFKLS
jgi:hypothetical protein